MITLADFLAIARDPLLDAWVAALPPAAADAPSPRENCERAFDGFLQYLYDLTGAAYRRYVQRVLIPRMRAGLTVADLHADVDPLAAVIRAEIERHPAGPDERAHLHRQLDVHLRALDTIWEAAARDAG